jgi:hypothetical protein
MTGGRELLEVVVLGGLRDLGQDLPIEGDLGSA